jgi:hypothetical protein
MAGLTCEALLWIGKMETTPCTATRVAIKGDFEITPDVIDLDQASGNDRKQQGQLGCAPLRGIAK